MSIICIHFSLKSGITVSTFLTGFLLVNPNNSAIKRLISHYRHISIIFNRSWDSDLFFLSTWQCKFIILDCYLNGYLMSTGYFLSFSNLLFHSVTCTVYVFSCWSFFRWSYSITFWFPLHCCILAMLHDILARRKIARSSMLKTRVRVSVRFLNAGHQVSWMLIVKTAPACAASTAASTSAGFPRSARPSMRPGTVFFLLCESTSLGYLLF